MRRLHWGYLIAGVVLAVVVFTASLLVFPASGQSVGVVLALAVLVAAGVVEFLANWRQAFEAPAAPAAPRAGRDVVAATGDAQTGGARVEAQGDATIEGDVVARDKITNIYEAATPAPRPGSAPPPPTLLVGRTDDLCALKAHLIPTGDGRARTQILTAIKGWPGVGKTTVAAALAHDPDIVTEFPGGVLWTSLGPKPNLLSELAVWGRALGVDLSRAASIAEACGALTARLRDVRKLLIVDDVWKAEHARAFEVGGRNCATLVTTRSSKVAQALALPEAVYLLPVLPDDQALELLNRLAPEVVAQHPQACRELARQLDGLPLALRVAGQLLHTEAAYGFSVDHLLSELRSKSILQQAAPADRADLARETTPTIAALLQTSTDYLDARTREAFASLGVFPPKPATFDLDALKAVWQVEDAKPIATQLLERGLLEGERPGRFQLHALLILHAQELLTQRDGQRYEAGLRHAAHYESVLRAARKLYMQGGESITRGLGLFDLEWGNIQAGQAWAAGHAGEDDAAARLCSAYPNWPYLLDLRLHPRERIRWMEAALAAARRLKDKSAEGVHQGNLGRAYADLGNARRAIESYEQATAIAREIGDRHNEGNWLYGFGLAYAALGEPRRAIELYEQALAVLREIGDRREEGAALGNLGNAYAALGDARRAIEFYEQQLVIVREIGDRRGEGAALDGLGLAYADLGAARRAIELYEQQLVIVREIGDRRGEGNALGNLGLAYADLGDARRAIELYEQQLVIVREIGDRRGEGNALFNMSLALDKLGERARAIVQAKAALEIYEQIESPYADRVRRKLEEWGTTDGQWTSR